MDNQHRAIKGYRDLSQGEIDLMNEIKAHAVATEALVAKVRQHVDNQERAELNTLDGAGLKRASSPELARLDAANPRRWLSIGVTDMQRGFMAITRAVAQPTTF